MDFTGMTVDFHGGPVLAPSPTNPREWILKERLVITIGTQIRLVCEAGNPTDGQSAPWWTWLIVGHPWELPQCKTAVPHDGCYRGYLKWYVKNDEGEWIEEEYTREESDLLHLALNKAVKLHWFKRGVIYLGVHFGGGSSWQDR